MAKQLYFIAIELPQPFKYDIQNWKGELTDKYLSKHALKTPPHITLQMPMRIEEENENKLLESLDKLNNSVPSGFVQLRGISSFPPRTIFIEVISKGLALTLYKKVKTTLMDADIIADTIPLPSFHPHVTLMTRDLSKGNFHKAWDELKDSEYNKEIEINAFHLYKHDGKFWRVLKELKLRNLQM